MQRKRVVHKKRKKKKEKKRKKKGENMKGMEIGEEEI